MNLLVGRNARGNAGADPPSSGPPAVSQWIVVGAAVLVVVGWYHLHVKGAKK